MSAPKPAERERRLAGALADFIDLEARGETVSIEQFCRVRADLQPELGDQLKTLSFISVAAASAEVTNRPERLSGYKILDEIGSGGMGTVYLALDERLVRKVAIKALSDRYLNNTELRTRFMQEARAMARLSHSNIVRIYNLGRDDEVPHFVMEHVEGVPFTVAAEALTLRQKVEMLHKVVRAVDFLHQNHVIHRDLKPANILVGADLQPRLLDFGLALQVGEPDRLTRVGDVLGTPRYFSPEQARSNAPLDARSDVFSLGTIFYELLTGILPFRSDSLGEEIHLICEVDPVLPCRLNANIPGELQNICLKALEKSPADRYGSAREMAEDLERYLAGEQPLAVPTSYVRLMSGKVEQHLRELDGWKHDEILSDSEYRGLRKGYSRLIEREDAWILEARRLTLTQVSLYLGAWINVVGAALLVLFDYTDFTGTVKVAVAAAAVLPMVYLGLRYWNQGLLRTGIAYLLAFCFLLPISLLVTMGEYGLLSLVTEGKENLELFGLDIFSSFRTITNAQMFWSLLLSLPVYFSLRAFTRSHVFSLVLALTSALLCLIRLLQMGMIDWLENEPGKVYLHFIPVAILFFAAGMVIERLRFPTDSRYFYPIAVGFTWIALTGLAAEHEGYLDWINALSLKVRMQREYLFLVNAAVYFALHASIRRLPWEQLQSMSRLFLFVIPGHVLLAVSFLGANAMDLWKGDNPDTAFRFEARAFEVLLPCIAALFVFRSVSRQMKNYFVWGMVFLAVGIVKLQQDIFEDRRAWLVGLILGGVMVMLTATNYAAIRMTIARWAQSARTRKPPSSPPQVKS